ncbi:hypothetical protein DPSP01_010048 [Paraphaeosphaeria sporulosa]|uniref:Uncharacterized protein n=1 Tax=Paraphaeosphaeria sporulosa TaxID=1460663 RepID=A0A177C527_9PLEO|nr:uncharacterized protein CC84DRAFT_1166448 [Paraphaeosphaeria sporulosa]OAG02615.1 hypothetical protein CC84DRAFT_1166448 [Paraphaeosphaeria sporulosa]
MRAAPVAPCCRLHLLAPDRLTGDLLRALPSTSSKQSPGAEREETARDRTSPSAQSSASDTQPGAADVLRISRAAARIAGLLHDLKRELAALDATAPVETRGSLGVIIKTPGDNTNSIRLNDVAQRERVEFCYKRPGFGTHGRHP